MRNLQLTNKLLLVITILFIAGCTKSPCLNIPELDIHSIETKSWHVDDSIGTREIIDNNGIRQSLVVSQRSLGENPKSVIDDCGNTYGSTYFSIQYNTSLSPLHLMVDINASAITNDGFYLKLTASNHAANISNSTTYDFATKNCRDNNATVVFMNQISISDSIYHDVLKFTFKAPVPANGISTVYYTKGYGLIKFTQANGNEFEIN